MRGKPDATMRWPQATIAESVRFLGQPKIGSRAVIHDFVAIYPRVTIGAGTEIFEGAVIGKPPTGARALARRVRRVQAPTVIGRNCVISPHVVIYSGVGIKDGTLVGDHASIRERVTIGGRCIISRGVTINYNVDVGNFTKIMDGTHITGNARIGSHVFIGMLVTTANDNQMGQAGYARARINGPTIEDYARIGMGASILPGVRIGRRAVVGAGSVVTRDVDDGVTVTGIPARPRPNS